MTTQILAADWSRLGPTFSNAIVDTLVMVCVTLIVGGFFDPELTSRGLGTFMILDHIERTRALGLPHLYLGYWVKQSAKMAYKARFQPQEQLGASGWMRARVPGKR